ncbi:MAG: DUF721 domain-containing protein [Mailhella sp.]|nr:DUF721 domain-containing protein [Mailhella sp.]
MRKRPFRRSEPVALSDCLAEWFAARGRGGIRNELRYLWENWALVAGELAGKAFPLGTRGSTLLIGAADSMSLQDIRMEYDQILDCVNAFMSFTGNTSYFDRLEFSLKGSRKSMTEIRSLPAYPEAPPRTVVCSREPDLDAGSPIGRLYAAFKERQQ